MNVRDLQGKATVAPQEPTLTLTSTKTLTLFVASRKRSVGEWYQIDYDTFYPNKKAPMSSAQPRMSEIRSAFHATGQVQWIGLRPGRGEPVQQVKKVRATTDQGLDGDRFQGRPGAERQVTLIQREHLDAVAAMLGRDSIDPGRTRRNIVVSGINLTALKGTRFRIGNVLLQGTGPCAPCSQMERKLGPGGYNAMRGHGGITACVIENGQISVGDRVEFVELVDDDKDQSA